jgi:hypothetical protein
MFTLDLRFANQYFQKLFICSLILTLIFIMLFKIESAFSQITFGPVVGGARVWIDAAGAWEFGKYYRVPDKEHEDHIFHPQGEALTFQSLSLGIKADWQMNSDWHFSFNLLRMNITVGSVIVRFLGADTLSHTILQYNAALEMRRRIYGRFYVGAGMCYNFVKRHYPAERYAQEYGLSASVSYRVGQFIFDLNYLHPLVFASHGTADTRYAETWHLRPLSLTASWLLDVRRWRQGGNVNCPSL